MSDPDDRARRALPAAARLVCGVRDRDPGEVAAALDGADLPALCVVLAEMVPDDTTMPTALAADGGCASCGRPVQRGDRRTPLAPGHGRHAAHGLCETCYRRARRGRRESDTCPG